MMMHKHGWVILDKPVEMTSTMAVNRVKRLLKVKKAGHAGTLDPLASGMLPIAIGEATKTVPYVQDGYKEYLFTVKWGVQTTTDDLEGSILHQSDARPTRSQVEDVMKPWLGNVLQLPPIFSALKVDGERAYDLAREGKIVELQPRSVFIDSLDLIEHDNDSSQFLLRCGKGTYVRSLARDMGQALGCFGHICALRRNSVAPFSQNMMIPLADIEEIVHKGDEDALFERVLRPVMTALDDIPALAVTRSELAKLQNGQPVLYRAQGDILSEGHLSLVCEGSLIGLGEILEGQVLPHRMFNYAKAA